MSVWLAGLGPDESFAAGVDFSLRSQLDAGIVGLGVRFPACLLVLCFGGSYIVWSGNVEVLLLLLWLLPIVDAPQLCQQCLPGSMATMMEPSLVPRIGNARALRVSRDGWTLLRACARSPLRHPASRHGFVAGDAAYHLDADHPPHILTAEGHERRI